MIQSASSGSAARPRRWAFGVGILAAALLAGPGCSEPPPEAPSAGAAGGAPGQPAPPQPADREPEDLRPVLIAFGDSLTAGYGIELAEAWPARFQALLDARGHAVRVVNAGVSGETSAGGLRRLPWLLDRQPGAFAIVIALGGNDGLRGIPPDSMAENLAAMVREARARDLVVLLAGVPSPPELGEDYEGAFTDAFRGVAEDIGVPLLPSLLEGVAGVRELNQRDRIHPNAEGARRLAANVLGAMEPLLAEQNAPRNVP